MYQLLASSSHFFLSFSPRIKDKCLVVVTALPDGGMFVLFL